MLISYSYFLYITAQTTSLSLHSCLSVSMSSHNLDLSGSKKRKRGERVFRFKTFGENGYPVGFVASSFRENVKALLEYGHLESTLCNSASGLKSWSFQLQLHRNAPVHLVLFVVEEPFEASLNRHCKHCQYVGKVLLIITSYS